MRALTAVSVIALLGVGSVARGQERPDLNGLALLWVRGIYGAPMLCTMDGHTRRMLRRVEVVEGPRMRLPPTGAIRLRGLADLGASRCVSELGTEELDVTGTVEIRLEGHSRPDISDHDFKTAIKRERGFDFAIASGRLRLRRVGAEGGHLVDFRSGTARYHLVAPGTDAERLLRGFPPGARRAVLALEAPDGTKLEFWMVQLRGDR